jgi:hypothetical protein
MKIDKLMMYIVSFTNRFKNSGANQNIGLGFTVD